MKTTSILSYAAAASLTVFFVSLIVTQDAWLSSAIFAATLATLIALHDYAPRSYFVITSTVVPATKGRQAASAFPKSLRTSRRTLLKRRTSFSV